MKNYKLNRLKYRVEFGNYEEIDSPEQKELINKLKSLVNREKTLTIKSLSI